jgi:hypothetical protein
MTPNRQRAVQRIVEDLEDEAERVAAVRQLLTTEELLFLGEVYNWDDGMAVPTAIIDHPSCDLGLALRLFELAEGIIWLTEKNDWKYQETWAAFCQELSNRVQSHFYVPGPVAYASSLSAVQRYKALKAGVPQIFLFPVHPENESRA